jgi:hypothetical protein
MPRGGYDLKHAGASSGNLPFPIGLIEYNQMSSDDHGQHIACFGPPILENEYLVEINHRHADRLVLVLF